MASVKGSKEFHIRLEVMKMLRYRGLNLRRTGHLFQIYTGSGTLFQSHSIYEIRDWVINNKKNF